MIKYTPTKRRNTMLLLENFLTAKAADGCRPRTLSDYRRVLSRFAEHIDIDEPDTWTRAKIRAYVADLRALHWSPATVALHIRYLRAFWTWCHREGMTGEDFAAIIPSPAKTIREETLLTTAEFADLVKACAGDRWALRDRAVILMLVDTGLRRNEFTSLQREHVRADDGLAYILLPGLVSKTGRERFVFLGRAATRALHAYLETRTDDTPALFLSERGPLGGDGIYYLLRRRAERAGIDDPSRVHPHLLRKMFASWWIENGGDEQRLMDIGGWSGPEMLRVYVRLGSRQKLQQAHEQYGPIDRLFDHGETHE